ncbi:DUF6282 family protein [Anaeroarcus burkinensis]|uniref:DUF6282 family protein n=1 Tax=Anaeroarcus burkinensis TaxID=82376 RepID=UPI000424B671|nr:DUF6282 family protein [Anaeroarcus burkinensis]
MQKSKVVVYNANKIRTEKSESIVSIDAESTVKYGECRGRISIIDNSKIIVVMNHHKATTLKALELNNKLPGFRFLGGVILNSEVGGLNIGLVEKELAAGAKEIWMPTISAENAVDHWKQREATVSITTDKGTVVPELYEILDLIAASEATLGTGYLSSDEVEKLIILAKTRGVQNMLVNCMEGKNGFRFDEINKTLLETGVFIESAIRKKIGDRKKEPCYAGEPQYCINTRNSAVKLN